MASKKRKKPKKKAAAAPRAAAAPAERAPSGSGRAPSSQSRLLVWVAVAALAIGVLVWQLFPGGSTVPAAMRMRVIRSLPHDPEAFTQGLLFHDGKLYESTGLRGRSTLRRVALETGEVEQRVELPGDVFAEGLARVGDTLVQITWQSGKAFVWTLDGFERVREHEYRGEGWGLCYDGERLIMSDGTEYLGFYDPETFERVGEVRVSRAGRPVRKLNELECVDGQVYANVWMDDHIARIDPDTGAVTAWIDASGLLDEEHRHGREDVLNGIAYVPDTGHFLLTGKNWARLYEVEFVAAE